MAEFQVHDFAEAFAKRKAEADKISAEADNTLKDGDGGGTFSDMSIIDLHTRLSRIEGGWGIFQWACAVVTAVMIGGMAILVSVQLSTQADVKELAGKVEALPDKINSNLMELNRTLSTAITASKNQTPQVILVPAPDVQQQSQTAPK